MSDFTAIRAVSLSLKALLKEHITAITEAELRGVLIDLRSPREMRDAKVKGISLWLYRVARNEHLLNNPPERVAPHQTKQHALSVNLYYLVTPITDNPEDEQALLGRVLQVFNDHAALRGSKLENTLQGGPEEFRVCLEPLSLDELSRVWDALKEPYQLSICYLVQVVTIDSDHEPIQAIPVAVKETRFTQILEVN